VNVICSEKVSFKSLFHSSRNRYPSQSARLGNFITRTGILQAKRGIAFICSIFKLNLIDVCKTFTSLNFRILTYTHVGHTSSLISRYSCNEILTHLRGTSGDLGDSGMTPELINSLDQASDAEARTHVLFQFQQ
jgi:hypothetical protein